MRRLSVLLAALGAMLLVPAASAFAEEQPFTEYFGSAAKPTFAHPGSLALQSNGDLVVLEPGGNEKQVIRFSTSPAWTTGDTFKLKNLTECTTHETAAIAYNSSATTLKSNVRSALGAVCGGTTNFVMAGTVTALTVEFAGAFAATSQPLMSFEAISVANVGATASVEVNVGANDPGVYRYKPNGEAAPFATAITPTLAGSSLLTEMQVAVDRSAGPTHGDVYVATGPSPGSGTVKIYSESGSSLGELSSSSEGAYTTACGVAVDSSGKVYVGDSTGHVHVYTPNGVESAPVNGDNSLNFAAPNACQLAAGAGPTAGSLFIDIEFGKLFKYTTAGVQKYEVAPIGTSPAVNPVSGHVYAGVSLGFAEFDASGAGSATEIANTPILPTGNSRSSAGIAVDGSTGDVYVSGVAGTASTANAPYLQVFGPIIPPGPELTVTKEGGEGTIVSNPAGIECGGKCSSSFTEGSTVTLTASPASGYMFSSWKGCDKGGAIGRQCTVTMSAAKAVVAKFIPSYSVSVTKAGSGLGKVQSSPGGVLCLVNCSSNSAEFKGGASVSLTAAPSKHFHLVKWTGDCSGNGACSFPSIAANHTVGAEFAEDTQFALTLNKAGGGNGTVKADIAGINCGATCTTQAAKYYTGTEVTLTATPGKGSSLKEWTGACSGSGTCKVTLSEAKTVGAKFE